MLSGLVQGTCVGLLPVSSVFIPFTTLELLGLIGSELAYKNKPRIPSRVLYTIIPMVITMQK